MQAVYAPLIHEDPRISSSFATHSLIGLLVSFLRSNKESVLAFSLLEEGLVNIVSITIDLLCWKFCGIFIEFREFVGEHEVDEDAKGPNISLLRVGLTIQDFRCLESRVTNKLVAHLIRTHMLKVLRSLDDGLNNVGLHHENSIEIQVPQNDAELMHELEGVSQLGGDVDDVDLVLGHLIVRSLVEYCGLGL